MAKSFDTDFKHEKWSSGSAFLLAAIGAAVGLGNLWRFPFVAGQNGGGAFVLIYIACVVFLCVPIMIAELSMGRRGQGSAISTMRKLSNEAGVGSSWMVIGWLSIAVPLIGLSFYSVVAGWSIDYVLQAGMNAFSQFNGRDSENMFNLMLASPLRLLLFHTLFLASAVFIVARGIGNGIELIAKFMMPGLFVILLILALNSIINADIGRGLDFLFNPDFTKIKPTVVFLALGQAFFSVAIGVGAMITYGAYVPRQISLPKAALTIALADAAVALMAGIVIFPLVFSNGLDPAGGPGLIFITLPVAFGNMPGGHIVGFLFFVLLFFAAFSSVVGMLEPAVSWLEEHKGFSRPKVTILAGMFGWVLGIAAALSFNVWSDVKLLNFVPLVREKNIFELLDFSVSNLMLPINALLIAIFAGWIMSRKAILDELGLQDGTLLMYLRLILRYVAPIAIGLIFYTSLT
jgi:NSS family neurotransmitter:Na+ symporter